MRHDRQIDGNAFQVERSEDLNPFKGHEDFQSIQGSRSRCTILWRALFESGFSPTRMHHGVVCVNVL